MSNDSSSNKPKTSSHGAIIDENGNEVPITDEMIDKACMDAKPQSIGKHTGVMPVITDEMLKKLKE